MVTTTLADAVTLSVVPPDPSMVVDDAALPSSVNEVSVPFMIVSAPMKVPAARSIVTLSPFALPASVIAVVSEHAEAADRQLPLPLGAA